MEYFKELLTLLPEQSLVDATDGSRVDQLLTSIVSKTSYLDFTILLDPCNPTMTDLIRCSTDILMSPNTRPVTRSKIVLLLSNLCLHNIPIRKSVANSQYSCLAIFNCLKAATSENLGVQNKIDVLRILQLLTYEKASFSGWIYELLPFLTKEILSAVSSELLPYCMCILCNLVSQSKDFANALKQMDSFKCVCSRILQFLSHDSKAVVISALVLVGYLDEKTRDTVYSSQNISKTFLCIFNILAISPSNMSTHVAVDLFQRLVVCQPKTPCDPYLLNPIARNLATYSFFERSIQKVANQLNILDPRSEESIKILGMVHLLCRVDELCGPICAALSAAEPTEQKLNTPSNAFLRIAQMGSDVLPEISLTAIQLLVILTRESIETGKSVKGLFSFFEPLCALIRQILLNSKINPTSHFAAFRAKQLAEALRLAEALTNDEEFRFELLEVADSQLCSALFDDHLHSNPIVHQLDASMHCDEGPSLKETSLPLWSVNAVAIPIQLLKLLASLKDYSKTHKDLYWRSLKDPRLLPFLAHAVSHGDDGLVYDAFVLFTHCAQVHDFPFRRLSQLTHKCAYMKKFRSGRRNRSLHGNSMSSLDMSQECCTNGVGKHHKDKKYSDLKNLIASLQSKLIETEEKLLAQQKLHSAKAAMNGKGGNGSMDMRHFVNELERRVVESDAEIAALSSEKLELAQRVEHLQKALESEKARHLLELSAERKDREILEEENEKERSLHAVLREKFNEMARKFDTAAKAIFAKQEEMDALVRVDAERRERLAESESELELCRVGLEAARKEITEKETKLTSKTSDLEQCLAENQSLKELKEQMAILLKNIDSNLKPKET